MKVNDKVKIISAPIISDNHYQVMANKTIGMSGEIIHIYKNGDRNIVVYIKGYGYNYYRTEHLELTTP